MTKRMNNIADPELLSSIKRFLLEYLPDIRNRDPDTIASHRTSINLFLNFLDDTQNIQLSDLSSSHFSQENIAHVQASVGFYEERCIIND